MQSESLPGVIDKKRPYLFRSDAGPPQRRNEIREDKSVGSKGSSLGLADVVPASVVRNEQLVRESLLYHAFHQLEMLFCRAFTEAIKLDPGSLLCRLEMELPIAFCLGMNPNEGAWMNSLLLQDFQLLQSGHTIAGMRGNGQPGLEMSFSRGAHQLGVNL